MRVLLIVSDVKNFSLFLHGKINVVYEYIYHGNKEMREARYVNTKIRVE